jgi:hypothetical protein
LQTFATRVSEQVDFAESLQRFGDGALAISLFRYVAEEANVALAQHGRRRLSGLGVDVADGDPGAVRCESFCGGETDAARPCRARDDRRFVLKKHVSSERELISGRLVAPLAGRATDITYVGHYLVYPPQAKHRKALRTFREWIVQELNLTDAKAQAPA